MKSSKLLWFGIKEKDTCYIVVFKKYETIKITPKCDKNKKQGFQEKQHGCFQI